jgi:4-amino-4-deoxy-L-arabinose transferase-like glycosyltransferase
VTPEDKRRIVQLTLLGLLLRVLFVFLEPAVPPVADERTWTNWAVEGIVPRHMIPPHHMIFDPPFYPYFIAVFYLAFHTLTAVKYAQAVVSALLVPAIVSVGDRVFSRSVGFLAGLFVACYPEFVWFAAHFWSETVFTALLWWAFANLFRAEEEGGFGTAALGGLVWGLATLTRETISYFTPVAALFLWLSKRPGGRGRATSFVLAALLTVLPWTYRNYRDLDAFIPVSTAGGLNLWQGNARLTREEVYVRYEQIHGRVEQYHFAIRKGLEAIWDRQPWWFFEKLQEEMPNFWEADSQVLVHLKRGAYGPVAPPAAWAVAALVLVPFLAGLVLFVMGLSVFRPDRASLLLLGFLAYYNLLHVVTHGYARYRLPAMPVVLVFAALGLRERATPLRDRRWLLPAVVGLALLASLPPSIRLNLRDPVFGLVQPAPEPLPESSPVP